jgi:ribose/xylose/arabinose/galactoside ABC-type transport system permease subunit
MTPTISHVASAVAPENARPRWHDWIQRLSSLAGLVAVVILFSIVRPRTFANLENFRLMLVQMAVVATASLGMTIIIVSGGIDISVGSTIAVVTMVVAGLLNWGLAPSLAALGGIACAALFGLVIGLLVGKARLIPFVVTLGAWSAYRGVAKAIGGEQVINAPDTWLNELMLTPTRKWLLVAPSVWIAAALAIVVAGMLRYTRFGRHVFAIGSNEQTARLCGVAVDRVKILVYILGGALAGVAGVLQFAYIGQGDPTTANGMELSIIAAVVIGGASLSGGQGTISGTLIGALIISVLGNGCTKLGLRNYVQEILTGVIIVAAHALDRLQRREET